MKFYVVLLVAVVACLASAEELVLDENEIEDDSQMAACLASTCASACKAKGYLGGICQGDNCWCWKLGRSADESLFDYRELPKKSEQLSSARAICDNITCIRACTRNGWRGGYCQNGQCMCWK